VVLATVGSVYSALFILAICLQSGFFCMNTRYTTGKWNEMELNSGSQASHSLNEDIGLTIFFSLASLECYSIA
jgi:hypothetical protein